MAIATTLPAIVQFLKDDAGVAALAGTDIFGAEDPSPKTVRDCVIVNPNGGTPPPAIGRSYMPISRPRYDVICYGRTPLTALDLYSAVRSAFHGMTRTVTTNTMLYNAIQEGGPAQGRDQNTQRAFTLAVFDITSADDTIT